MAYREPKPQNKHDVRRYHSWFTWRKCEVCEREFRREKGFSYCENDYFGNRLYVCRSCGCNSQDYLNQYIDYMNHGRLPETHPMHSDNPTPPPMRQIPSGGF